MSPDVSLFRQNYTINEELGRGGFCVVYRCTRNSDGNEFAVKKFLRSGNSKELAKFRKEVEINQILGSHPNIAIFYESFAEKNNFYMIFELITGGELFHDIVNRETYSESDASAIIQQVLSAIEYIHSKNIAHRDVKPENLLLASSVKGANIKLVDFGLSIFCIDDNAEFHGLAGSRNYLAPEVICNSPYGKPVDIWAAGVVLYALLSGEYPFYGETVMELNHRILSSNLLFINEVWQDISDDSKQLLTLMLCKKTKYRITASEALKHPWISNRTKVAKSFHRQLTIQSLKNFNAPSRFKTAVITALATHTFLKCGPQMGKSVNKEGTQTEVSKASLDSVDHSSELIELTEKFITSIIKRNFSVLSRLVEEKFNYFQPQYSILLNGTQNYEFEFINVKESPSLARICNPVITQLSNEIALVCFTTVTQFIEGEKLRLDETKDSLIFSRSSGSWKVLHHHRSKSNVT